MSRRARDMGANCGKNHSLCCGGRHWWNNSGVAKFLKEKNPAIKVWGSTPMALSLKISRNQFLTSRNLSYITEGIGEDILPANVDFSLIDHFEKVTDKDAAIFT